jgi:hypothetical protein
MFKMPLVKEEAHEPQQQKTRQLFTCAIVSDERAPGTVISSSVAAIWQVTC